MLVFGLAWTHLRFGLFWTQLPSWLWYWGRSVAVCTHRGGSCLLQSAVQVLCARERCLMFALFICRAVFIFMGLVMDAGTLARRQDGKKRVILRSSAISTLSPRGKLLDQGFSFFS